MSQPEIKETTYIYTQEELNQAMDEAFKQTIKDATPKSKITIVRILNDGEKELIVRLLPPNTGPDLKPKVIPPRKMAAVFIEGEKVFLKVWENNTILICKDGFDEPKSRT